MSGAGNIIRPSSGFGNPNAEPCAEARFLLHCTSTE